MGKRGKIILGVTFGLFILLIAIQHYAPEPVNWSIDLRQNSKNPYGTLILQDMLQEIFSEGGLRQNGKSFFLSLRGKTDEPQNLLIFTRNFSPDQYDMHAMLDFAGRGNNVFIAAQYFSSSLEDTLNFTAQAPFFDTTALRRGDDRLNFIHPTVRKDSAYQFVRYFPTHYFSGYDTTVITRLGVDNYDRTNFMVMPFGEGRIFLHCQVLAFTNFHLLYGDPEYAAAALSHLPDVSTVWDNYYKPGKVQNTSPVRYILSQPPLRAAYYVFLISLVIYMIFEGKRKQRRIPVIKPLRNTSLQFIETVARLYYRNRNHNDLARKKVIYFRELLREKYYIRHIEEGDELTAHIAYKTGLPEEQVSKLLTLLNKTLGSSHTSADELLQLNQEIENFNRKSI